jgi:lipopolysaccharide transport system permease protein
MAVTLDSKNDGNDRTEITNTSPYQTILKPSSGWAALNLLEVWKYRDLLLVLAMRDVKLRYRQTALGVIWVVLQPLLAAGIFSFVFGKVAKMPSDGVPYFIFSYAGQLGWNLFSGTLSKSSAVLVGNSQLVSKIYFPRLVLPLSTIFSCLIDFGVALAMMVVLMICYHIVPHIGLLLFPLWLLLFVMMGVGIGLITSALSVEYRDINYVVPIFVQFLMYASPVAYSVSAVPIKWHAIYMMNPLSGLLEAFRWSFLGVGHLDWAILSISIVFSIVIFVVGAFSFRKMERRFADVI